MPDSPKQMVERLFAQHRRRLVAFFSRRLRTKADAPDLAQEVYLRMLRISDPDAIRNPELYLYTVASNLLKERAILDRRQSSALDIDDESVQAQLGELPTSDGDVDTDRRIARLRVVLAQLSPKCRAAVVLQYRCGLTYQEIGDQLGVSPHMVKKYLCQALVHCRRRMAEMR